jgi:hypothetical protein
LVGKWATVVSFSICWNPEDHIPTDHFVRAASGRWNPGNFGFLGLPFFGGPAAVVTATLAVPAAVGYGEGARCGWNDALIGVYRPPIGNSERASSRLFHATCSVDLPALIFAKRAAHQAGAANRRKPSSRSDTPTKQRISEARTPDPGRSRQAHRSGEAQSARPTRFGIVVTDVVVIQDSAERPIKWVGR